MSAPVREPLTPDEWQEAVDMAHVCLLLESARHYGLVTGGPTLNLARCLDVIDRGLQRGVVCSPEGVDRGLRALLEETW